MKKTLKISFSLRNAYHVNGILFALKQIPLVKKLLPEKIYGVWGLKVFANVLSAIWEIVTIFLGKLLYFLLMLNLMCSLYQDVPKDRVYLHILLILTVIGAYGRTILFHPSRDKYYAMILLRMDAREYTLVNYAYQMLKDIVGFLPFSILFGLGNGVPLWLCILFPFSTVGGKILFAAYSLGNYEKNGYVYNEDKGGKVYWIVLGLLLLAAYLLPAVKILLPAWTFTVCMLVFLAGGILSVKKLLTFPYYREVNQQLLASLQNQMDAPTLAQTAKAQNEKIISTDKSITSKRRGFEYLNELFIRRHQKILWKASVKLTAVFAAAVFLAGLALFLVPKAREPVNRLILNYLPYFVFIMYSINRGTGFTRTLFMNCDHSLLTYSFFKQPGMVLKLFRIRLREIIKINLPPALVIGGGLSLLLYVSGGTENPVNYGVIFVSILCQSMFFSVHYLTIYYLLQPYNQGTEMKSGTYSLVTSATYFICFFMMQVKMPTLLFGGVCIAFCILYMIVACVLVYRFAPETFRIRS